MELWDYTGSELIDLPIDAVAMLVLADFAPSGWHVGNFFSEARQFHHEIYSQPGVPEKLHEAWAWLETNGLVGRHTTQDSEGARRVTAAGREALEHGLSRLKAAQRLNVDLHASLAWTIRRQFLLGEFELAAFAALREVEIRVRSLGGFPPELLGVPLMRQAFRPSGPGPLTDPSAEGGEQEAMMALFAGAIGTFKNPLSHRPVEYDDPVLAAEVVLLADLLMRLLDRIASRLAADGA